PPVVGRARLAATDGRGPGMGARVRRGGGHGLGRGWARGGGWARRGQGAGRATALGALGFGLAHLGNPGATAFSTLNVALAGVWLACAFFSPGGMPLAWGAHFGWNATLALGFEAPVSGYVFPVPAIAYRAGAHGWIDGGAFGPEGGIVTTLEMLVGTVSLVAWSRTFRKAEPTA